MSDSCYPCCFSEILSIATEQLHVISKMDPCSSAFVFYIASDQSISGHQRLIGGDNARYDPILHTIISIPSALRTRELSLLSNQEIDNCHFPTPNQSILMEKVNSPKRKRKTARFAGSVGRLSRATSLCQLDKSAHSNPKSFLIRLPCLGPEVCPGLSFCTLSTTSKRNV
jgi:hypothetical protein